MVIFPSPSPDASGIVEGDSCQGAVLIPLKAISILPPTSNPAIERVTGNLDVVAVIQRPVTVSPPSVRPDATLNAVWRFVPPFP